MIISRTSLSLSVGIRSSSVIAWSYRAIICISQTDTIPLRGSLDIIPTLKRALSKRQIATYDTIFNDYNSAYYLHHFHGGKGLRYHRG